MFLRFALILIFLISTNIVNGVENAKDKTFPDNYFDSNTENKKSKPNIFENGKVGDEFIKNQDSIAHIERGNPSEVVKCPCKKKGGCGGCHLKSTKETSAIIPQPTQYRFIPMPAETDEQINPYFMMLSRQRLLSNTTTKEVKMLPPPPAPKPPPEPPKIIAPRQPFRPYNFLSFGSIMSGASTITSYETSGTGTAGNIVASSAEIKNFTVNKAYDSGQSINLGGGFSLQNEYRFEFAGSVNKILGSSTLTNERLNEASTADTGDMINFNIDSNYGNAYLYTIGANGFMDMRDTEIIAGMYPSIGAGLHFGYMQLNQGNANGVMMPIYTLSAQLNYDIDETMTMFIGARHTMANKDFTFDNSYTDRSDSVDDSNNKALLDNRILADRNVKVSGFSVTAIEVGFRFW